MCDYYIDEEHRQTSRSMHNVVDLIGINIIIIPQRQTQLMQALYMKMHLHRFEKLREKKNHKCIKPFCLHYWHAMFYLWMYIGDEDGSILKCWHTWGKGERHQYIHLTQDWHFNKRVQALMFHLQVVRRNWGVKQRVSTHLQLRQISPVKFHCFAGGDFVEIKGFK